MSFASKKTKFLKRSLTVETTLNLCILWSKTWPSSSRVSRDKPLPVHKSQEDLVDQYTNFFLEKILKIRDVQHDKVCRRNFTLTKFVPVSNDYIRTIILSVPQKSCELDILETRTLKKVSDKFVPIITKIINISLCQGMFVQKCKLLW